MTCQVLTAVQLQHTDRRMISVLAGPETAPVYGRHPRVSMSEHPSHSQKCPSLDTKVVTLRVPVHMAWPSVFILCSLPHIA